MKYYQPFVTLGVCMLIAIGCTPESSTISTPPSFPQSVVDSAPYVCKLIPEQAFRLIGGATGTLTEGNDGNDMNGDCWAPDATPRPLEVRWMQEGPGMTQEHLDFLLEDRRRVFTRHGGVKLPDDLGDGMAAYLSTNASFGDPPYRVSAMFSCGTKERIIDIDLIQVAKGRDAMKDLTDLMRIAQKRYSQIHDCTLTAG